MIPDLPTEPAYCMAPFISDGQGPPPRGPRSTADGTSSASGRGGAARGGGGAGRSAGHRGDGGSGCGGGRGRRCCRGRGLRTWEAWPSEQQPSHPRRVRLLGRWLHGRSRRSGNGGAGSATQFALWGYSDCIVRINRLQPTCEVSETLVGLELHCEGYWTDL